MAVNGRDDQGDLRVTLAVSQSEAAQGTTRLLYLPDGRTLNVIIPPGTPTGQVIRIDGQGLPMANRAIPGALLITITYVQNEPSGAHNLAMSGSDTPTAFHAPPPPPVQQSYTKYPATPTPAPVPFTPPSTPMPSPYYAPGQVGPSRRTPSRKSNRRAVTIAVIAGLVVLLAASGLTYYAAVFLPGKQHTIDVQNTTIAQNTAVVQANMTGTAQASATAYPQNRYNQITSQKATFSDSLANNTANSWDENSHCTFAASNYQATEEQTGFFFYCMNNAQVYHNFAFQVKMTFLQGSLGGIIFRANTQNSKYYLLRLDNSGRYDLFLYVDSNVHDVKKIGGDVTDAFTGNSNQPNLVTLIVQDNTFALYINSQYVITLSDPNATLSSGNIGVTAEDSTSASEIAYSQAKLWKL